MDLEIFYQIEKELNKFLILDIIDIIFKYLNINYNQIINKYIERERDIRFYLEAQIKIEFEIEEHIEEEIYILVDHLPYNLQPRFVDIIFNQSPQIDFCFEIRIQNHVWEILGDYEPGYFIDCDYL